MDIKSYKISELPSDFWPVWEQIQQVCPELESPYFSPEFAKAVGFVREDTEVGVLFQAGQPVGFFPFHRGFLGVGQPLAGHLSDFQGVIAFPHATWTLEELIGGCGLIGWDFDHVSAGTQRFTRFANVALASPFIDLPNGFHAYEENRKANGSRVIKNLIVLARKLEREVGPMRFEFHRCDPTLLEQMLSWKRDQYENTGVRDVLAQLWTVNLLREILHTQTADFAGVLSVLWVGDRAIAVHMGMRSRTVWHYWFPAYDAAFHRYSPGLLLLIEMIKAAEGRNLKKIDLGKGDADYKRRLMTGATPILEGSITISTPVRWARKSWRATKACLRGILWYPVRFVRNVFKKKPCVEPS